MRMTTTDGLTYQRLEGTFRLEGPAWCAGEAADIGTLLDVPAELLDGPVAVTKDGVLIAAIGRSIDFRPFSVVAREDLSAKLPDNGITIRGAENLTLRAETNAARAGFMGFDEKPETDFLIIEAETGFLARLA
jgi:hypothetical protein